MGFYNLKCENPPHEICEKFDVGDLPVYCGPSETWAAAINKDTPIYSVYYGGTNRFVILRKYEASEWEEIKYTEVDNLYGLIWRLVARDNAK